MAGVCALIPAAGRAVRFGGTDGKLFELVSGKTVLERSIAICVASAVVDKIVVVAPPNDIDRFQAVVGAAASPLPWLVVAGGDNRQESVRLGLAVTGDADYILVHDAARPAVGLSDFRKVVAVAREVGAAILASPVSDTLVRADLDRPGQAGEGLSRDRLWAVQTPQVFRSDWLRSAHFRATEERWTATDDAGLVSQAGFPVQLVAASAPNVKLTRREDLELLEAILSHRKDGDGAPVPFVVPQLRIGHGYDVHALVPNRPLWLGGVHFPDSDVGLEGHSDADVVLHALCDALLGAAGLDDIGHRFPNTDATHRNRPSIEFVQEVKGSLDDGGWEVLNVDMSVMAQRPKLAPKVAEMRSVIASAIGIPTQRVGLKATTNEGLGFVGRCEGIAAHAVVLLQSRNPK